MDTTQLGSEKADQKHEPFAFVGGDLRRSKNKLDNILEESVCNCRCIRQTRFYTVHKESDTWIYTSPRPLLQICTTRVSSNPTRCVLSKLHRWLIQLSRPDISIAHIEIVRNKCADRVTRWAREHIQTQLVRGSITALYKYLVSSADSITWPNFKSTFNAEFAVNEDAGPKIKDGILRRAEKIVISYTANISS